MLSAAFAQKLECQPKNTCKRPVEFLPTALDYVEAIDCEGCAYLYPDPRSPEVKLRLKRDKNEAYTLEVKRSNWNPEGDVTLQARYVIEGNGASPQVLEWQNVVDLPLRLLTADVRRTRIGVQYRLKISGDERVGSFGASITYTAEDDRDKKNKKDTVSHDLLFVLEPALVLRLEGATVSGATDVEFDVSNTSITNYFDAVAKGQPLSPSKADLQTVSVFSNYANGYTVTAQVERMGGPVDSSLSADNLWVEGEALLGKQFVGRQAVQGFSSLLAGSDYGLRVDGTEKPGDYRFSVTFQAIPNP